MRASSVKLTVEGEQAAEAARPPDGPPAPAATGTGTPDGDLVRRCQNGDLSAFEELLARYQDRIFNLVYRLVGQYQDAQDITQDVFLRALEHIGGFRQQAQVYTWLFRIAVNLAISRRRRGQRVRFVSLERPAGDENDNPGSFDPPNSEAERPEQDAQRDERARLVARAIGELDEEFRSVLVLKDIEDFDYQEIAEILQLPLGTVKSRLHRARCELKGRLRPIVQ